MSRREKRYRFILCITAILAVVGSTALAARELARVGTKRLTTDDLRRALAGYSETQRANILNNEHLRESAVENLVNQELLYQEALRAKVSRTKAYQKKLAAYKRELTVGTFVSRKFDSALTESAAKKFYKENQWQFKTDQARVSHILLHSRKKAEAVYREAKKGKGQNFDLLVNKYSKDASAAENKGDVGYFPRGRMDPSFTEAAFTNRVGSIVGPIRTAFGYHIIKVTGRRSGKLLKYSEVEFQVKAGLRKQLIELYLAGLKKKRQVVFK